MNFNNPSAIYECAEFSVYKVEIFFVSSLFLFQKPIKNKSRRKRAGDLRD